MSETNSPNSAQKVNKNSSAKTAVMPERSEADFELTPRSDSVVGMRAAGGEDPVQAMLLHGAQGVFGSGSINRQATRLSDPHLAAVQRQA
ncbi:MAG: hypothetical protein SW833_23395, partial [Cyanobacteriota bacterium]|nr:hypothetical protein [Cyanobacteriota bacterium]